MSLPPTYPTSSSPQLQLLSRYIGAFAIDAGLFGSVIRTYISANGVDFVEDQVCVFDGLQNVLERCVAWYEEQLSLEKVGQLAREELKEASSSSAAGSEYSRPQPAEADDQAQESAVEMPPGVVFHVAEPIHDRKSIFIGRACRISHPSDVCTEILFSIHPRSALTSAHDRFSQYWRTCYLISALLVPLTQ